MSTTQRYIEIKDEQPTLRKCFFAFSKQQFEKGKIEAGIGEDEEILSAHGGLFGTQQGIDELYKFYKGQNKRIAAECNPQDIYNYEWNNYECMITYDDEEAIQIVVDLFGVDAAKTVKRKYGYTNIEMLK